MRVLVLAGLLVAASSGVTAIYVRDQSARVPVARLVAKLEPQVRATPNDGALHLRLARVHAMAWVLATPALEVSTRTGEVMFGYEPPNVPFAPMKRAAGAAPAHEHLTKAIAHHRRAVALMPDNLVAELGLAWCLDRAGEKAEARTRYRSVGDRAWATEQHLRRLDLGQYPIAAEAAAYLLALLDPSKDAREIAALKERQALARLPRPVTPIVVPLDDQATVETLIDREARVRFDLDGRDLDDAWTWITPRGAWLAWDPGRTGAVRSGLDLFGSVTFWTFWPDGYHALAGLDDNGDGWIAADELRGLALWHDVNGDGISGPGEVLPVARHGIVALRAAGTPGATADVVAWAPDGVRLRNGARRPTFDLRMTPAPARTVAPPTPTSSRS